MVDKEKLGEAIERFSEELSNYPPFNISLVNACSSIADIFHRDFLTQMEDSSTLIGDLTEIHRLIKLLEIDVVLLRSAKQETTQSERLKICQRNLNNLWGFYHKLTT
jgi:hypothetical protein